MEWAAVAAVVVEPPYDAMQSTAVRIAVAVVVAVVEDVVVAVVDPMKKMQLPVDEDDVIVSLSICQF